MRGWWTVALLLLCGPAWAQALKITLLGTGVPEPRLDRFGPATLVEAGDQILLFDCGRGASQRLWQRRMPLSAVDAVFLTHLHSDHVVGLPDLWLTGWMPTAFGGRRTPLRLLGPRGTRAMATALRRAYEADIRIRHEGEGLPLSGAALDANDIRQGVVYRASGVTVTAFDVDHGPRIKPAFGYRIDYAGHAVVLSGDTRSDDNLLRFARGADVVVHEVAAVPDALLQHSPVARRVIAFHTTPEQAARTFSALAPKLAVYTHVARPNIDPAFGQVSVAEIEARTRQGYAGPLVVGHDGMTIAIDDAVRVIDAPADVDAPERAASGQ